MGLPESITAFSRDEAKQHYMRPEFMHKNAATDDILLSRDKAVGTVFAAISEGKPGETYVPKVAAAKMVDVAKALMGDKDLPIVVTGIRPEEKIHEIMVSEEECFCAVERNGYYAILPVLPELQDEAMNETVLKSEYSSSPKT